jgi:hypothetical protein
MLAAIWRLVSNLVIDVASLMTHLAPSEHRAHASDNEEPAQQDDLLDAMLDDDEIDATGL